MIKKKDLKIFGMVFLVNVLTFVAHDIFVGSFSLTQHFITRVAISGLVEALLIDKFVLNGGILE